MLPKLSASRNKMLQPLRRAVPDPRCTRKFWCWRIWKLQNWQNLPQVVEIWRFSHQGKRKDQGFVFFQFLVWHLPHTPKTSIKRKFKNKNFCEKKKVLGEDWHLEKRWFNDVWQSISSRKKMLQTCFWSAEKSWWSGLSVFFVAGWNFDRQHCLIK